MTRPARHWRRSSTPGGSSPTPSRAPRAAPGWDVYELERQWREWIEKKGPPQKPDAAFVEFDFAIGYPDLFVELVLPRTAFASFCASNRVRHMDAAMAAAVDADMQKWRYGESRDADE